jgi:hypothetical protein
MADARPITINCKCRHRGPGGQECGRRFTIVSAIGPSHICDECAQPLIDILGVALRPPFGNLPTSRNNPPATNRRK